MTSVANNPVQGDSISSGTLNAGKKSHIGDRATFLGTGQQPNHTVGGVFAGTLGGSLGPGGNGLPGAATAVPTLTKIETKRGY